MSETLLKYKISMSQFPKFLPLEQRPGTWPTEDKSTSLGTGALDLDASFSTVVSTKFGRSPKFKEIMGDFHLSNIKKQLKGMPFKSKVSSKKIRLRWK